MITLIFVRHGASEPSVEGESDEARKLVKRGIKQMKRVAELLDDINVTVDRVFSSRFLRAYQSADVICDELKLDVKIETIPELEPGRKPLEFINRIKEFDNLSCLVVSHEPLISKLLKAITGANIETSKGSLVLLSYNPSDGESLVKLVIDQKVLQR
ncbi:MAG: phosphohistidine phosphatase SixA [Thermoplasmatales archaeon]|nr:phosphohistidine phosphatase SixA [Thermoplasmatales archaeon]MCW6170081.1 phosphohistidine phosphatase SixA [Thermoplasmatales archaeon]